MRTSLLISILLLAGCVAARMPLYDRQPEIVKVDARMTTMKQQLGFLGMMGAELDMVAARRHIDLIGVFYSAFEVAFADGDNEKFQLMINRVNAQIDDLNRLIESARPVKPMSLIVPEISL